MCATGGPDKNVKPATSERCLPGPTIRERRQVQKSGTRESPLLTYCKQSLTIHRIFFCKTLIQEANEHLSAFVKANDPKKELEPQKKYMSE